MRGAHVPPPPPVRLSWPRSALGELGGGPAEAPPTETEQAAELHGPAALQLV